ncbi:site-specific DNA-methyltransferase [Mycoplasmopsis felis]|uniref:site-specific DNA-methyltransferase n=1 Tax=Mycoplasmopsis felis TaxID=33923 RepID=UPI002AFE1195|nr:site-specific DNA-methyltransferase [Mycoplasmopsis felis]WQQ04219.1 site-specific DNA-methyltransferase [Mycoplasmopsis felis]
MNKNIFQTTKEILMNNPKYISEDNKLLKAKVYSDVMTMNKDLLSLLLSNNDIKQRFFIEINGTLIFDKQKFAWFIDSKEFLPNSYTRYTNKIGLTHNGEFLSKTNDVVLDFPYKDCVLEGGQSKDDQKRNEIFYNEIIASDEINQMLAPKVLSNAKRYTKDGIQENISFDENDNLIIKGNNLIALASLLKRYEGKVKCIYIDPPYNTGNDSFNYNDSFNHSTWLVFMKNRLELAKILLSEDGVIFVQCDDNEQAYLKVLMDDIFGRQNTETLIWNKEAENKSGTLKQVKRFRSIHEFINISYKNINNISFNKISEPIKGRENELNTANLAVNEDNYSADHPNNFEIVSPSGIKWFKHWKFDINQINDLIKQDLLYFGKDGTKQPRLIIPMDHRRKVYLESILNNGSTTMGRNEIEKLFDSKIFSYPKPEILINKIIDSSTNQNDLILDFFLGSGTTAAVAHKMNRRYIGIEQMDYIQDITIERLKKVIDGEQGGISKSVNWNGGGSFVYCELLENTNSLISQIQDASNENITIIKNLIYSDNRIVPYLTTKELQDVDKDFETLSLKDKKQALIKLIDKNKLYVNYSDIDDASFNINKADKKFSKSFYDKE